MSTCEGDYVHWIYKVFGDCISTPRDYVSFAIGTISNILWLVCSLPQIYHNFKNKHVDGQSPFYFALICAADLLSLVGAIVTHALSTQIVTGFIYITLDIILLTQYTIYRWCKKKQTDSIVTIDSTNLVGVSALATVPLLAQSKVDYSLPYKGEYLYGSVSGWIGSGIYITARIIQLLKNIEVKVITDFSPVYISILISANLTYSLSVFIRSVDPQYLWKQTPWIVGSIIPMTFDCITAIQMCIFGYKRNDKISSVDVQTTVE
ncbi:PQ loop repeat family protein [Histomonas meleagridis]|uniref:PQ loop repeat family protein n=1 Tax=Histomonas meleagridis TaxID=135588 RepID=UPI003559BF23|nr:PQ loop repeat family protein [Histomonas meleagridis]KAH0798927.1 PQ loop repeat family protein [Histomonas meleagridis]